MMQIQNNQYIFDSKEELVGLVHSVISQLRVERITNDFYSTNTLLKYIGQAIDTDFKFQELINNDANR